MVSLPTYDPNTLDANWEALTKAEGKPFFNRVLQGAYQPGIALQTPLMAAALLANYPLDTPIDDATQLVKVGDVIIQCVAQPPTDTLTLPQAYAYGCPYPFAKMVSDLGFETIQSGFNTFDLDHPPTLTGYVTTPADQATSEPKLLFGTDDFTENALGQGKITVTPLEMAVITAAIFNDGNAPVPYSLLQTRQPNSDVWLDNKTIYSPVPMLTANSARQMQTIMQTAVQDGDAQKAAQPDLMIAGHAGLAYVGTTAQSWFIGFVTTGSNQGAAIAVVLENTNDAALAAEIGGQVLGTAHSYQMTSTPQPKGGA
jgi:peptidoglycan glycosyltransferase